MHIPTFVFIFILFLKNILLLLLYPKHVIKPLGYNLGCYKYTREKMVESKSVVLQMIPHTLFIEWDFWTLFTALFTSRFTVHNTVH